MENYGENCTYCNQFFSPSALVGTGHHQNDNDIIHKSKNFQKFTFRACLQNAEKSKNNFQHLLRLRSAKFSAFFTNYRLV